MFDAGADGFDDAGGFLARRRRAAAPDTSRCARTTSMKFSPIALVAQPNLVASGFADFNGFPTQYVGATGLMKTNDACHARHSSAASASRVSPAADAVSTALAARLAHRIRIHSAWSSASPVRMRSTRSRSVMKILPSPTLPVLAASMMASTT